MSAQTSAERNYARERIVRTVAGSIVGVASAGFAFLRPEIAISVNLSWVTGAVPVGWVFAILGFAAIEPTLIINSIRGGNDGRDNR